MTLEEATVNELLDEVTRRITSAMAANGHAISGYPSEAGRDLAIAKTHIEDAQTRYNSARYRMKGTWKRADPDKEGA